MKKSMFLMAAVMMTLMAGQSVWAANSRMSGFVEKYNGELYVSTNLYVSENGEDYLIEDHSGLQKLSVSGNDLMLQLKGAQAQRVGEIGVDLAALKERQRTQFELVENVEVNTVFLNKKRPKTERYLSCGITGCGIGKRVIERTQRIVSLKVERGAQFCLYQNIDGKLNGVLYPSNSSCK